MRTGLKALCVCVSVLFLSNGCGQGGGGEDEPVSDADAAAVHGTSTPAVTGTGAPAVGGPNAPAPPAPDAHLFGANISKLEIDISPSEMATLKNNQDSHGYVHCTVKAGGQTIPYVGIHCRGNPAQELATGKPDLIVTFDKFVPKQRFHGQRRLVLQANRDDPSYVAVPIVSEMFLQAGVPAPRCGFATVRLNGRDLGFYVLIEGVEREFIQQHFGGRRDGNLYDEGNPPDITGRLEKAMGKDKQDQSDVDALAVAALTSDPSRRWTQLQQRLDVDRFMTFTALEVLWWLSDSYSLHAKKFRLYHDMATTRFVFFPKNIEEVLRRTDGPAFPDCKGVVARGVLTTPEGQAQYRERLTLLLDTAFVPDKVQARARALAAAIRPTAVGKDAAAARKFDDAVKAFCEAVARRAQFVASDLKVASAK